MTGGVQLVVDARSSELRRRVGPNAWVVLEELLLGAAREGRSGVVVARATVRALAERTALSKDTVSRAIQQLRRAQVIDIEPERHDDSGRFVSVRYLVDLARMPISLRLPVDCSVTPSVAPVVPVVPVASDGAAATVPKSSRLAARRPGPSAPTGAGQLSMLG